MNDHEEQLTRKFDCIVFADDTGEEKLGTFTVDLDLYHSDTFFEGQFITKGSAPKPAFMKLFPPRYAKLYKPDIKALEIMKDAICTPKLLAAGSTLGSRGAIPGGAVIIKSACPGERLPWGAFWNKFTNFNSTNEVWVALKRALKEFRAQNIELWEILSEDVLWDKDSGQVYIVDFDDWDWAKENPDGKPRSIVHELHWLTRNFKLTDPEED
ncbi:uncharacterized protein DFL_005833 [Arthrobotrys flagrans]|uniref:Aminoglycoside phosphotransferase domain-containing protein n=1 Tax=Arthrobotrys flagrans TaxID=97331 RepID=A0A436ZYN3_ARTFL|nr:hypothetical protein DFL_005833 [Arthrobotrys flagrans]